MQRDKILSRNLIIKRSRKSSKKRSRRSSRKRSIKLSKKRSSRSSRKRSIKLSKKRSRKRSKRSKRNKHIKNKSNIFINLLDGADKRKLEDVEESPTPLKKPKAVVSFINQLEQADVIDYYNNIIKNNILHFDETNKITMNVAANDYLSEQVKLILKSKKYEDVPEDIINKSISKLVNLYEEIKSKTVRYENGDLFIGKLQDNLRNGEGIMFYSNGDKYEGSWKNDKKEGKGKIESENGITYVGDFKNGNMEGEGKISYPKGKKYQEYKGNVKDGKPEGKGKIEFENGITYVGDFKNGILEGEGIMTLPSGYIYKGNFSQNKPEGTCKISFPKGSKYKEYEGNVKDGKPDGKGKMEFRNGSIYVGHFQNGNPEGTGKMEYGNGNIYVGHFQNGNPEGTCKISFPEGNKYKEYEGNVKDGKPDGKGKMEFGNGNIYVGDFKNGNPEGTGKMEFGNGNIYVGDFKNGNPEGTGKISYTKSSRYKEYEGNIKDSKPEGKGKMEFVNGCKYEGEWVNGSREGKGLLIFNSLIRDQNIIAKIQKYSDVKIQWNKNFYYGDWVNGVEQGQGVRLNKDFASIGDFNRGLFQKGVIIYKEGVGDNYTEFLGNSSFVGECKIIYPNGSIFEGFSMFADDDEDEEEIIEYGIITTIEGEKSISTRNLDNVLINLEDNKKYFDGTFVYPDFKIIRDYPVFESNFDNFKLLLTHLSAENNKDLREICKFGDKICKADEKILSKHSKYFKWYFSNNNTRNSETLSLIFYNDQNVCEKILYYLYFGEFTNDEDSRDNRLLQIIQFLGIDTKPGWYIDYLWKNKTYFENDVRVIFKSRDRSIKAHVSILCNNSPYFATVFSDRWKYDEVAVLEEFTSEIFDNDERSCEKILYYLYFGKFEIIKDNKNEKLLKILDFLNVKTSPDIFKIMKFYV